MDSFHGFMCLFNLSFCVSVLLLETSLNKHVDLKRKLNIRFQRHKGIPATKEEYFNIFQQSGYGWMTMATFPPSWVFSTLPSFIELDDGKIYRKALYLMVKTMVSCRFSLKPIHWILGFMVLFMGLLNGNGSPNVQGCWNRLPAR